MFWILEKTAVNSWDRDVMLGAIRALNLSVILADGDFATGRLLTDSVTDLSQATTCYGSTRLMQSVSGLERSALFSNQNFNHSSWLAGWGDLLLNAAGSLCSFGGLDFEGQKFLRPEVSDKAFAAQVVESRRLPFWKERIAAQSPFLKPQTMVLVADVQTLQEEARFFVVDGKVVAGSRYAIRGQRDVGPFDPRLLSFCEDAIAIWRPHDNFVIDIADTQRGPKIVEVNCLNTSSLYRADPFPIVESVTRYVVQNFES